MRTGAGGLPVAAVSQFPVIEITRLGGLPNYN